MRDQENPFVIYDNGNCKEELTSFKRDLVSWLFFELYLRPNS